jgi:low temperature requirement protein LtrA
MARPRLHAPQEQPVTFVELFFDLVFVFAVTQVTVLTAHHLDFPGVGRSVLLFWLVWWAWTQFTWTLSPADTQHPVVRVCVLVATGSAFVMAASVSRAFEDDALWFAVPYIVIRLLGMAVQVLVDRERDRSELGISMAWLTISTVGLIAVLAGALVDPPARNWLWLLGIALDLAAAAAASRNAIWDINPRHFSERHGLFVIIALGESLIVAGTAVAGEDRTAELLAAAGGSLLVVCLLWWTYFGWLKDALEHGFVAADRVSVGPIARDAFSLLHFPLICGVVGFAVAVEEMMLHPEVPASGPVIASLAVGVALFVGSSAMAYWRISGQVLGPRLVILLLTSILVILLRDAVPVWPLAAVATGLLTIAAVEGVTRQRRPEHSPTTAPNSTTTPVRR